MILSMRAAWQDYPSGDVSGPQDHREEWLSDIKSPEIERGLQPFTLHNTGWKKQTDIEREICSGESDGYWENVVGNVCVIHKKYEYLHPPRSLPVSGGGKRKTEGTDVGWDPWKSIWTSHWHVILDWCGGTEGKIRH